MGKKITGSLEDAKEVIYDEKTMPQNRPGLNSWGEWEKKKRGGVTRMGKKKRFGGEEEKKGVSGTGWGPKDRWAPFAEKGWAASKSDDGEGKSPRRAVREPSKSGRKKER